MNTPSAWTDFASSFGQIQILQIVHRLNDRQLSALVGFGNRELIDAFIEQVSNTKGKKQKSTFHTIESGKKHKLLSCLLGYRFRTSHGAKLS